MSFGRRIFAGTIVIVASIAMGGLGPISIAWPESVAGAKEELLTPQDVRLTARLSTSREALAVAWSPDGRLLAASTLYFADITVWDAATHKALKTLNRNVSGGDPLDFAANNLLITSTARSNSSEDPADAAAMWDIESGNIVSTISGPRAGRGINNNLADALSLNPRNGDIAIIFHGPHQNEVGIYDHSGRFRQTLSVDPALGTPSQIAFSPNGRIIAIGTMQSMVGIYDADDLSVRQKIKAYPESFTQIKRLAFSPDGKSLATGPTPIGNHAGDGDVVEIWDVATGALKRGLQLQAGDPVLGSVRGLSWRPDGRYIAVSSSDNMVRVWNTAENYSPLTIHRFSKTAWSVAFSPDGKQLAVSGDEGVLLFNFNR